MSGDINTPFQAFYNSQYSPLATSTSQAPSKTPWYYHEKTILTCNLFTEFCFNLNFEQIISEPTRRISYSRNILNLLLTTNTDCSSLIIILEYLSDHKVINFGISSRLGEQQHKKTHEKLFEGSFHRHRHRLARFHETYRESFPKWSVNKNGAFLNRKK